MEIIDDFIERYTREYDFYFEASRLCATICENKLEQSGIRSIVTYRAKRPDRLKEKVEKRILKKNYKTVDDIYQDLIDLAGIRIALYFPGDFEEVDKIINSLFKVLKKKEFPQNEDEPKKNKIFSGYKAIHYHVNIKEANLTNNQKRFSKALIEIQVASVLMHGWAEVEHDLVYKPYSGEISEDEYAILDELNGLVLAGEIALKRLQRAIKRRVEESNKKFNNHFELSSFIYDYIKTQKSELEFEPIIGRADILLEFLEGSKLDSPKKVKSYIDTSFKTFEDRPIVEQIIDNILTDKPELYALYEKLQFRFSSKNPDSSTIEVDITPNKKELIGEFITRWTLLEGYIYDKITERNPKLKQRPFLSPKYLAVYDILPEHFIGEFDYIRRFRNDLVHGKAIPTTNALKNFLTTMDYLIEEINKIENNKK
jgi:ppGpp synthetase/RelA/SpoT-type nucleotidyltranferase